MILQKTNTKVSLKLSKVREQALSIHNTKLPFGSGLLPKACRKKQNKNQKVGQNRGEEEMEPKLPGAYQRRESVTGAGNPF